MDVCDRSTSPCFLASILNADALSARQRFCSTLIVALTFARTARHLVFLRRSFCNHATGDPITRITRRIGAMIVAGCMDDQGASICVKDRRLSSTESNAIQEHLISSGSAFVDIHVRKVTCVWAGRVLEPVLLLQWIKMRASAGKCRAFALSHGVKMDRMKSLREPFDVESQQHPFLSLTKKSGAKNFPVGVFDISARLSVSNRV
jgi:hypothetical protein